MTVKVFGQLTDITGSSLLDVMDAADTNQLIDILQTKYPALKTAMFKIAVNRDIIQSKTVLQQDAEVALLPPYSGG